MAYKEPKDLPKVPVKWTDWSLKDRILAAKNYDAPERAKRVAVAISLIEQPTKIPCNNCAGIMAQGETKPWGWRCGWKTLPVGYAMIKEGQTGKVAPFLAFAKPQDSLSFLIDRVVERKIETGEEYARRWVGETDNAKIKATAKLFDWAYRTILNQWVTTPSEPQPPVPPPRTEVVWWKSKRFRSGAVTLLGGLGGAVVSIAQGNWIVGLGSVIVAFSSALGIWWGVRDSGVKIIPPQLPNRREK